MNTAHDMGGMQGFGAIEETASDSPLFHAEWEQRVLALTLAMGATGSWNIDQSRAARENMHPAAYLNSSYFEIWFSGLQKLMLERGLVTPQEIATGKAVVAPLPLQRKLLAADVVSALAKGSPTERPTPSPAQFKVGDSIRVKMSNRIQHTRVPRYIRGHVGHISAVRGGHVFADANAQSLSAQGMEVSQWLYTVRFDANELWGADTSASEVYVDCWESYLE
jgi:nitrile hydratase subunit beta